MINIVMKKNKLSKPPFQIKHGFCFRVIKIITKLADFYPPFAKGGTIFRIHFKIKIYHNLPVTIIFDGGCFSRVPHTLAPL